MRAPRRSGSVRVGTPDVRGDLEAEIVRRVVRSRMNELRQCYERHLAVVGDAAGKVTLRWLVASDGSVSTAAARRSTVRDPEQRFERCLLTRVRFWAFPAREGVSAVQLELDFRPDRARPERSSSNDSSGL